MATASDVEQTAVAVPEKTVEELKSIFEPFDIRINRDKYKLEYPVGLLRKASILIPLCFKNGEYHLILTLRSDELTHHAGNVAFPGGMMDETDTDLIHAALREAEEEIGLKPEHVEVLSVVAPGIVRPNSLVYPVIGLVSSDYTPVLNKREVSLLFEIPLKRFLSTERRRVSDFKSTIGTYHVHHFIDNVDGKEVDTWGFTASLCVMTALAVHQTEQKFIFLADIIYNKDNVFDMTSTRQIIELMHKSSAKL